MNRTLREAKYELRARIYDGIICPCCDQLAKSYKRKLYHTPARALISLHNKTLETGRTWHHIKDFTSDQVALLRYWNLVEEKTNINSKKKNSGFWRITMDGISFASNLKCVQSHIVLYDAKFIKFRGPFVNILQCLGKKFNYGELMNG